LLIIQLSEPKPTKEERSTRVEVEWSVFIFYITSFLSLKSTTKQFQLLAIRITYKVRSLFQTWKH